MHEKRSGTRVSLIGGPDVSCECRCLQASTLRLSNFFGLLFLAFGNGPNTVSESTLSNTELGEVFWRSPSSGERTH